MNNVQITDIRKQIKASIRQNSNQGYINNKGCVRICTEMMFTIQPLGDDISPKKAFDIYIVVLLEVVKLFFHADATSGSATDIINACLKGIGKVCNSADKKDQKHYFDTIIKSVQIRAFRDWPYYGYKLLKYAVCFVNKRDQAQRIYDLFFSLGKTYDGSDYPDKLIITHDIIERLDGKEAGDKYLMENIHVPELRVIAVERFIEDKLYQLAETLCVEAISKIKYDHFNKPSVWAYYLEKIYAESGNHAKLLDIVCYIFFHGDMSYFKKLKELYQQEGVIFPNN